MRFLLPATLLTLFASGCYATTSSSGYVGVSGGATVTTVDYEEPDLVEVSPGIQVIPDYDEPVFYTDGFYWRETGGVWYRSNRHNSGWVTYSAPRTVISIENRNNYRRYRPANYTPRARRQPTHVRDNRQHHDNRPVVRDNRHHDNRPVVRDNRTHEQPRHQPVVRDNRHHEQPVVRDNRHQPAAQPVVRDNRHHEQPAKRDNRDKRKHDDDDDDKRKRRR